MLLLIVGVSGFVMVFAVFYIPEAKPITKQPVDHEQYYCHETGFLMHHWELQKGNGNWIDTMERNRWEEPIKCEVNIR